MDNPIQTLMTVLYARLVAGVEGLAEVWPEPQSRAMFTELAIEHRGHLDNRGQARAGNLISLVIGIAVAVIVAVGVAIPITNDVIEQSNLTGLTAMIVGFIPVMLGVLIFVATVGPIMART